MAGAGEEGSLLGTWVGVERCEFCSEFCVLVLSAFVLCFLSNYGIIHTFMIKVLDVSYQIRCINDYHDFV